MQNNYVVLTKMSINKTLIILSFIFLTACTRFVYVERVGFGYLEIYEFQLEQYYIRIPYLMKRTGGTHSPLDVFTYKHISSTWIQVNSTDGKVELPVTAKQSPCPFKNINYGSQNVKGNIVFKSKKVLVQLLEPNGINKEGDIIWVDSMLNGIYDIRKMKNIKQSEHHVDIQCEINLRKNSQP